MGDLAAAVGRSPLLQLHDTARAFKIVEETACAMRAIFSMSVNSAYSISWGVAVQDQVAMVATLIKGTLL